MINGKKVLAIIPARGGSKGIPRKNVYIVDDKPLIAYTILNAQKSKYIDKLILSSDNDEIIEAASRYGCDVPFIRPSELAQDNTPGIDPVLHAIEQCLGFDYVVLLQPTSPLRTAEDIDISIEMCITNRANSCVSVTETEKSPFWMFQITDHKIQPLISNDYTSTRRQELPKYYALNGAVYVAQISWLKESRTFISPNTVGYVMPVERSIDIDTMYDLKLFEIILNEKGEL